MFVNVYANPDNYDCIFTFYVSVKKHVFPITKYLYRINETKKKLQQNHFYKLQNKIHNHHVHPRFSNYTIFTIYIFPLNPLS